MPSSKCVTSTIHVRCTSAADQYSSRRQDISPTARSGYAHRTAFGLSQVTIWLYLRTLDFRAPTMDWTQGRFGWAPAAIRPLDRRLSASNHRNHEENFRRGAFKTQRPIAITRGGLHLHAEKIAETNLSNIVTDVLVVPEGISPRDVRPPGSNGDIGLSCVVSSAAGGGGASDVTRQTHNLNPRQRRMNGLRVSPLGWSILSLTPSRQHAFFLRFLCGLVVRVL